MGEKYSYLLLKCPLRNNRNSKRATTACLLLENVLLLFSVQSDTTFFVHMRGVKRKRFNILFV